jgi:hypothetical protein
MMRLNRSIPAGLMPVILASLVAGCSAVVTHEGIEQRASQATGLPVGSFSIANQVEGNAGRIDFTVNAKSGATYRCYMYSATGFQRAMSFGQTPHSEAICTPVRGGAAPSRQACDALSKAAGKC